MGTKNKPGKFDCYFKAEGDEPMFTLLARDPCASLLVRLWVHMRDAMNDMVTDEQLDAREETNREKHHEALKIVADMETWFKEHNTTITKRAEFIELMCKSLTKALNPQHLSSYSLVNIGVRELPLED